MTLQICEFYSTQEKNITSTSSQLDMIIFSINLQYAYTICSHVSHAHIFLGINLARISIHIKLISKNCTNI